MLPAINPCFSKEEKVEIKSGVYTHGMVDEDDFNDVDVETPYESEL